MISITRSLARQVRAVFRRLVRRCLGPRPLVSFQGTSQGLRVRLHGSAIAAEYHLPGSHGDEVIVLPLEALAACEGSREQPVTLEQASAGIQVHWRDHGMPQIAVHPLEDSPSLADFPRPPESMLPVEPGFLTALAEASLSADQQALRYATDHIQLQGSAGCIVATDGKQLLMQKGLAFPWTDDVLVPASPVYGCRELAQAGPVQLGRTDSHVVLQAGPWTLSLPIDKESRFPQVERVVPSKKEATAHCQLGPEDRDFLVRSLRRLPGGDDEHAPVTVDLNGEVLLRAHAEGQDQAVELLLARSRATGKPFRLAMNRKCLERAMRLGLPELHVQDAGRPVLFADEKRDFVVMPLDPQGSVPASEKAIRISSTQEAAGPVAIKRQRRKNTVNDTNAIETQTTNVPSETIVPENRPTRTRKPKTAGVAVLIQEAEAIRNALRDLTGRSHKLLVALKRQRKQSKIVQSSLKALKELQHIDG
ncbi:MAG: hypothetical protein FJ271_24935 [Planctomycetes bacterium]|nr:hypothetical protein [Planctomycetota bacterium]